MGEEARGYSWAPFEPGNVVALRHGARSARTYGPLAEQLAAVLLERRPDLAVYTFEVSAWAEAETRAAILRHWIDAVGLIDPETKEPRGTTLKWLLSFERLAAERRRNLGLDPRSAAELAREQADATLGRFSVEEAITAGQATPAGARGVLDVGDDDDDD